MNPIYNEWISEAIERGDFVHVNDNVFLRLNSVGGLTLIAELKARWVNNNLIKETAMPNEDGDDIQEYKKPWVGLTDEEKQAAYLKIDTWSACVDFIEKKLKEKNA